MTTKKTSPKEPPKGINTKEQIKKILSSVSTVLDDEDELAELFLVEIKKSLDEREIDITKLNKAQLLNIAIMILKSQLAMLAMLEAYNTMIFDNIAQQLKTTSE